MITILSLQSYDATLLLFLIFGIIVIAMVTMKLLFAVNVYFCSC